MAYVETWDETKPAGSRDANLGDDDIREFKRAVRERLAGGGQYFPSTDDADAGLYNYIKFIEQSSNPTSGSNRGFLFTKDVSGVTELYWMDSAGTVIQLTTAGKLLLTSLSGWVARGDLIRGSASGWERVALGTSGQVLKSDGTDAAWAAETFAAAATQAEQEAGSITTAPVTPGRQQYHKSAVKAWVTFTGSTGVILDSYNVASVVRDSAGNYTITWTVPFSSASYVVMGGAKLDETGAAGNGFVCLKRVASNPAADSVKVVCSASGTDTDPTSMHVVALGDQ